MSQMGVNPIGINMNYPDIGFTPEYQELFRNTAFGGAAKCFQAAGIEYRFYRRPILNTEYFDTTSMYGYSGPVAIENNANWAAFLEAFHRYCVDTNIIAEFARLHPYIENHLALGKKDVWYEHNVVYIDLTQSESEIWKGFDKGCRSTVKWGENHTGMVTIGTVYGEWWCPLYMQTMKRRGATDSYQFTPDFFADASRLLGENIKLFQAWDHDVVVAAILILGYGDFAHYFLSASDENLGKNRTNSVLCTAIRWAKSRGCKIFNLGGGLKAGDSLESFKCSFSHTTKPFYTYRKIHDQEVYNKLCQDKGINPQSDGWFPAYRRG